MPGRRTAEDCLRSEYVRLLPALQRTSVAIETEVRHRLLSLTLELDPYERVIVKSRIKDCESAIDALRRRQPYGFFDSDRAEEYSLTNLPDLVGVRVLAFPPRRLNAVRDVLLPRLRTWAADHMPASNPDSSNIGLKYSGRWHDNDVFRSEIQIVSLLIGLFYTSTGPKHRSWFCQTFARHFERSPCDYPSR